MAEGYMRACFNALGREMDVLSAGTAAFPGLCPSREAVLAMKEINVDVSGHKSSLLDKGLVKWADIILVMEPHHRSAVISLYPKADTKVFLFRKFQENAESNGVPDPIGRGIDFYRDILEIIKESTEGFIKWLRT